MNKTPQQSSGSIKKKVCVTVLVIIALGVLTGGVYATWLITPPAMPTTADQAAALLTSARFARLPDERKAEYLERMRDLVQGLDEAERRAFFERHRGDHEFFKAAHEARRALRLEQARQFALAEPAQRMAMLDEELQRRQQRRGQFGRTGPHGPRNRQRQTNRGEQMTEQQRAEQKQQRAERIAGSMARRDERDATANPQDEALLFEFHRAVRMRAKELGLQVSGWRGRRNQGAGVGRQ